METPWYHTFFGDDYARFDNHPQTAREVRFVRTLLAENGIERGLLLDVACGSGRHAAPLRRSGFEVVGLDRSDVLLQRARRRRSDVQWVKGDMLELPFADGAFDAGISMFSSLGYFDEESRNYRVLSEIGRVLRPDGTMIVEAVNRDFFIRHAPPQSWFAKDGLTVLEAREFDPIRSRSEVDVVVQEGSERRRYHHSIRLYTVAELAMLLASLEVDVTDIAGDFDGSEFTVDSPRMILVGQRR